jgi:hypothetical protein
MADAANAVALAQGTPVTNVVPVVDAIGAQTVQVGGTLSFTVTATDANGDAVTFAVSGLPAGASFNAATGAFSWPNATPAGTYNVAFTASDGRGTSAAVGVAINVVAPSSSGGGGGGGGSVDLAMLLALLAITLWRLRPVPVSNGQAQA